jgi:hypothetical protein
MDTTETSALKAQIEELQKLLGDLSARLARLEAGPTAPETPPAVAPAEPAAAETREEEPIPPEVILVIGAAVTAFLGKKVKIRHARRVRPAAAEFNPWAQQGRVFIQASHMLSRHS